MKTFHIKSYECWVYHRTTHADWESNFSGFSFSRHFVNFNICKVKILYRKTRERRGPTAGLTSKETRCSPTDAKLEN